MKRSEDLRVGDSERDRAISLLGEHLTAGRLDVAEFDQRCTRIAAARFRSDIGPVFADLPGPRPTNDQPRPAGRRGWVIAVLGLVVAAGLLVVVRQPLIAVLLVAAAAFWFASRLPARKATTFGRADRSGK